MTHGGNKERVVKASAGITFSLVLTDTGKGTCPSCLVLFLCHLAYMSSVFSFGSAEKGQLGNGTTGERITTGNKTAFDIEERPSEWLIKPSITTLMIDDHDSICQRTRWKEDRPDCVRTAA